ncbi:MAG: hypothetical protein K9J81_11220 [Desulfohalobiaceae bacterium]|nr:hypothetical protein [Desulfohalobiaceae bacterium]
MDGSYYETLTEIVIDNYSFKVTWSAASKDCCILWIQDTDTMEQFEALGRFSQFDKRNILEFIVRYVTNSSLRETISKKRFALYIENLAPTVFEEIQKLEYARKVAAFKNLYNLDSVIDEAADLRWKRRCMAKKFHPDKGGDKETMALINEGYEILKSKTRKPV